MKLRVSAVSKTFGATRVLDRVTLDFDAVASLVLIGPSGGGKSTLLRILAGLEYPDPVLNSDGAFACWPRVEINNEAVVFDERALAAHRRKIGVVFQAFNLFPHLTALENVTLPLEKVHGVAPAEARDRARQTLARFRLAPHADKKPAALSGGQRQRVAIARAIAIRPRLLLFDEPTSALDPEMTGEVLGVIEELREEGRDFILVTHEMGFARRVADQVALLADGRIVESGSAAQIFGAPEHEVSRQFLSKVLRY
ncbi:MAG: amino acid ABC transporter ATP-binding protein [Verrucomicrobia bacterium]|nr:amino acid ABC transporter ATP-binding protein [Verrucomicrobiota bacterium]MBV9657307.1 amino acid ABC transporter ATP-binding protein [Verrucomicrobiota bacterium]